MLHSCKIKFLASFLKLSLWECDRLHQYRILLERSFISFSLKKEPVTLSLMHSHSGIWVDKLLLEMIGQP